MKRLLLKLINRREKYTHRNMFVLMGQIDLHNKVACSHTHATDHNFKSNKLARELTRCIYTWHGEINSITLVSGLIVANILRVHGIYFPLFLRNYENGTCKQIYEQNNHATIKTALVLPIAYFGHTQLMIAIIGWSHDNFVRHALLYPFHESHYDMH